MFIVAHCETFLKQSTMFFVLHCERRKQSVFLTIVYITNLEQSIEQNVNFLWTYRAFWKKRSSPLFTKLKRFLFTSRGWENRTPAKGFGDPYHTIWPIPYVFYKSYLDTITYLGSFCNNFFIPSKPHIKLSDFLNHFWSSPRPISIGQLQVLPLLHLRPIYLVVFEGSYCICRDISSWGGLHA